WPNPHHAAGPTGGLCELRVPDLRERLAPQSQGNGEDDEAVAVAPLEAAAAVHEFALSVGEHDLGQAGALEASHRHEAVRDLLAVRADVLDRRRAHRAGNSGEALDPGASPLDRLAHQPVPLDPRPGDELHPVRRVAERDAADGDLENEA